MFKRKNLKWMNFPSPCCCYQNDIKLHQKTIRESHLPNSLPSKSLGSLPETSHMLQLPQPIWIQKFGGCSDSTIQIWRCIIWKMSTQVGNHFKSPEWSKSWKKALLEILGARKIDIRPRKTQPFHGTLPFNCFFQPSNWPKKSLNI